GDSDWTSIEWRGSRVVQHTEDMGSRATYPPMPELPTSELYHLLSRRLRPDYRFDQSLVSPLSVAARVAAITREMPDGGHILVVGDDDFLSPALARAGYRVTVVELDERVVRAIETIADELELSIEFQLADVRDDPPAGWAERFDAAVTDPIYDAAMAQQFVRFSLNAIRPGGLFFLSFASWMEVYRDLFPWLLDYGLRLRRLYPRMNEYYSGTERGQCGPFASLLPGESDPDHVVPPPLFYSDFHAFEYDGVTEQEIASEAG
ncbi:MAG: bis-aminopropyl spermidine synthase family protein, partial [Myxococcales bacterium]|nr:bis-aminopropyl spermidine synthase family protein [Myxococcales bacterium]